MIRRIVLFSIVAVAIALASDQAPNCLNAYSHDDDGRDFCQDFADDDETYDYYVRLMDLEVAKGKDTSRPFVSHWIYSMEQMDDGEFVTGIQNLTDYESAALYTVNNVNHALQRKKFSDAAIRKYSEDFYHFEPLNFFVRSALRKLKEVQGYEKTILYTPVKGRRFESCEVGEITFFDAYNFATSKEDKAIKLAGVNGTVFRVNSTDSVVIKAFFGHYRLTHIFTSCPRFEVTNIEEGVDHHFVDLTETHAGAGHIQASFYLVALALLYFYL